MFWEDNKSPTSEWKMASSSNKGKAPMQGSSFRRATSLQGLIPATITYYDGTLAITLQEVLKRTLQYCNGVYPYLPPSIKVLLDNLQRAYTKSNQNLFQRTLNALELHLVNLETGNIVLPSQLFGKKDAHSMDKLTIMGTDYARFSLKTQASLRSAVANLPSDIQVRILQSKAMSESHDQWFAYFKILVTTHFPVYGEDSDDIDDIFLYTNWGDYFGCSLRVYEKKHPFPGLIVNFENWREDEDKEASWLSMMFEYGFIRLIKLSNHQQISQFPQIIQQAVAKTNSPFVSIRCWSTLPQWDSSNWMDVQLAHHLVLINGYTHQGPWYDGDSYLSYRDPHALADCWRSYFTNEILEATSELWRNYYFVGNTDRITVFTNRPYFEAINLQGTSHIDPQSFVKRNPDYEAILLCAVCNEFAKFHEHGYNEPWDPYDGYNTSD